MMHHHVPPFFPQQDIIFVFFSACSIVLSFNPYSVISRDRVRAPSSWAVSLGLCCYKTFCNWSRFSRIERLSLNNNGGRKKNPFDANLQKWMMLSFDEFRVETVETITVQRISLPCCNWVSSSQNCRVYFLENVSKGRCSNCKLGSGLA